MYNKAFFIFVTEEICHIYDYWYNFSITMLFSCAPGPRMLLDWRPYLEQVSVNATPAINSIKFFEKMSKIFFKFIFPWIFFSS